MVQLIRPTCGALCAAALALLLASPAGAATRACTASDLQGSRAPAMLRDHGLDTQDGPLIAGTRYRVVVVQELANADNATPVDGSVTISGAGLQLTSEGGRPACDFTPAAGTMRLTVSWQEEVGYGSGDICSASQSFDLPVLTPLAPTLTGRFKRGDSVFGSSFVLRLRGKAPQIPGKVTIVLRARRGTTKPPAPRGRALGRFAFTPSGSGGFTARSVTRRLARTFQADTSGAGVEIFAYPNIAFGRTLRFAFSLEVLQDGKRIGGMRSGASCRRVQLRQRSVVRCKPVGLKQQA